ncbi:MAG: hypothetical protein IJS65_08105, partial [Clostridia bacterium]|nr:hypothetical protein [Clostridia bacterium]
MKMRVRVLCAALILSFFISVSAPAAPDVVFLAVNNTVLRPLSVDTIPIYVNGETYIPYSALSSLKTVKYYYNRTLNQVLVYDFWQRLTFDLAEGRTFDESGEYYDFYAIAKNGTVYLPLIVISTKFDFYISASHYSEYGALIRINEGDKIADDREYTESVNNLLKRVYDDYADSLKETVEPGEKTPAPPPEKPASRISYLMLRGDPKAYGERVLSSLGDLDAAFFLTAGQIRENGDFLRRLVSEGRTVGIYLSQSSETTLSEQLKDAERALREQTLTVSRFVCVDGGSAALSEEARDELTDAGVRLWDPNLEVTGLRSATIQNRASRISTTVVFGLDITEASS